MDEFKSTNNLDFEIAESRHSLGAVNFRVGTCTGVYSNDNDNYIIIGIGNRQNGNGHLQDVFDWFENSCKRDNKNLKVVEIMNKRFYNHLINKRGFVSIDNENVIKYLKK